MKLRGHWLDVTAWTDDYGIEQIELNIVHPPGCPVDYWPIGPTQRGPMARFWRCNVGFLESEVGLDTYIDRSTLRPGWYELEPWSSHTPSTPSFPEEWDAGLTLARGPYPGPPGTIGYELAVLGERVRAVFAPLLDPIARRIARGKTA